MAPFVIPVLPPAVRIGSVEAMHGRAWNSSVEDGSLRKTQMQILDSIHVMYMNAFDIILILYITYDIVVICLYIYIKLVLVGVPILGLFRFTCCFRVTGTLNCPSPNLNS